jgi:hypothetical protein
VTDIPALFQPEMVYGIDQGRKTATRRLAWNVCKLCGTKGGTCKGPHAPSSWQKVKSGDRLWVREQHWRWGMWIPKGDGITFEVHPAAMGNIAFGKEPPGRRGLTADKKPGWHKRPSIYMPREHSRFTLPVTATKIEPLWNISERDAMAEGVELESADPPFYYVPGILPHDITAVGVEERSDLMPHAVQCFRKLWIHINGRQAWESNPEVVAVSFRVIKANIDAPEARLAA